MDVCICNLSPSEWADQRSRQGDIIVINQLITIISSAERNNRIFGLFVSNNDIRVV